MTTACGALNNIVVDTNATAQWCVEFLRTHNIGRATFQILEQLQTPASMTAPFSAPEGVPRLFDLITPSVRSPY